MWKDALEGRAHIPEGPELLRSRNDLDRIARGKEVVDFRVTGGRYSKRSLVGLDLLVADLKVDHVFVESINVHGKFMWWTLRGADHGQEPLHLWCTYGMAGRWQLVPSEGVSKHASVVVETRDQSSPAPIRLEFYDPRHFGTLKIVRGFEPLQRKLASLGPDMLSAPPELPIFASRLRSRPSRTLAEALMDQSTVSGVGNYVKAESLYEAQLSPHRTCGSLSDGELEALLASITGVMTRSVALGGATLATYRKFDGGTGSSQERFAVYGRKVDPLGNPVIHEETLDGRTTWWVPNVQS